MGVEIDTRPPAEVGWSKKTPTYMNFVSKANRSSGAGIRVTPTSSQRIPIVPGFTAGKKDETRKTGEAGGNN